MNRYYSDVNNAYYTSRQQSDNIRASGWQSSVPTTNIIPTSLLPLLRIVVECPFGPKKCDYTIDKSQRGRLIVAARRRHTFKYDYLLSKNKDNVVLQTFTIPPDADVDQLQSHIERWTNRLIIEMPRLSSSYKNTRNTYTNSIQPPTVLTTSADVSRRVHDDKQYTKIYSKDNQKIEYRVDCHDYTADELDVFVQGRDLIVQGKTKQGTSSDPNQEHVSKKFTRKIPLPNTADLSKIVSYFENGELRIQVALQPGMYYNDGKIYSSELTPTVVSDRAIGEIRRIQSPVPSNHSRHHRRHEHISHHRDDRQTSSPVRRERSAESLYYPSYRSSRDYDEDDGRENRRTRIVSYDRNDSFQQPIHRSVYTPTNHIVTTRTNTYRD
ncbi:unnamed protein product [Adineta steineri]|uniref:SHSP domain-containing protein n=1 Tax=Adineta steineri TaxID=433720 RepID=A0A814NKW7_9BILA|nr:unnamed protein product [Adineta steineri]CAF1094374.1 unnamed protein product [Adineta steineri]CAF1164993.1 unnamed protein product [Adineta steineri]CAF3487088.1 unnamed protein product [Adineta steineri]CAF3723112.1 unnamed protein product [Adineta steineri]